MTRSAPGASLLGLRPASRRATEPGRRCDPALRQLRRRARSTRGRVAARSGSRAAQHRRDQARSTPPPSASPAPRIAAKPVLDDRKRLARLPRRSAGARADRAISYSIPRRSTACCASRRDPGDKAPSTTRRSTRARSSAAPSRSAPRSLDAGPQPSERRPGAVSRGHRHDPPRAARPASVMRDRTARSRHRRQRHDG